MDLADALNKESEKFGLRINYSKTKIMPITRKQGPWQQLVIEGKEVEMVRSFKYLGSEIKAEGGIDAEIKRRKALAGSAFQRLKEKIFKRHDISLKTKIRVLNAFVIPVLLYGSETWALTQTMAKSLDALENSWLRRILRISYKEHTTTDSIRQRTGQTFVSKIIQKRRLKWAGHMLRMEEHRAAKMSWRYYPQGRRPRGRPRTRWKDCLENDLKAAGLSLQGKTTGRNRKTLEEVASDRVMWRQVIEASLAGNSCLMN